MQSANRTESEQREKPLEAQAKLTNLPWQHFLIFERTEHEQKKMNPEDLSAEAARKGLSNSEKTAQRTKDEQRKIVFLDTITRRRTVRMSNEEMVAAIQSGAPEHMGELWQQVERLVSWKASRVMTALNGRGGVGYDDLYQSGYPAMVAAVDSYKPEVGAFSTWFMLHLKTAFAEATGYRSNRQQRDPIHNAVSLDTPLTDDADSDDLMDTVPDPAGVGRMEAVEEAIYRQQLHDALEEALEAIPEECGTVLRQRYYEGRTLSDLAEEQGVSMEMIRKRERDALRQLRKPKTACRLRPFHDFDFYCGTGLGTFRHTGMSIQDRYLLIEDERRERAEKARKRRYEETTAAADEALTRSRELTEKLMKELPLEMREYTDAKCKKA